MENKPTPEQVAKWTCSFKAGLSQHEIYLLDGCMAPEMYQQLQGYLCAMTEQSAEIERLKGAQRWIPVSEGLPEPYVDVLTQVRHGSAIRQTVALYVENEDVPGSYEWLEYAEPECGLNVTHWMLLPSLPKDTP